MKEVEFNLTRRTKLILDYGGTVAEEGIGGFGVFGRHEHTAWKAECGYLIVIALFGIGLRFVFKRGSEADLEFMAWERRVLIMSLIFLLTTGGLVYLLTIGLLALIL